MLRLKRQGFLLLAIALLFLTWPSLTNALSITPPDPVIKIPGLSDLSQIEEKPCPDLEEKIGASGCLYIPWIGEYVGGLYKFAVLASTILATVVIMIAGFIWLTAGGNVNQIGTAKSYIGGAIMGLVLMLGSYTVLNLINPKLVIFDALKIPVIKKIPLELIAETIGGYNGKCTATEITSEAGGYEAMFNKAGKDFGIDPFLVAAIAKIESNFNANVTSRDPSTDAFGIMQVLPATAKEVWNLNIDPVLQNNPPPPACLNPIQNPNYVKGKTPYWLYQQECKDYLKTRPEVQIRLGAAYLAHINSDLLRSKGKEDHVGLLTAGYNRGPGKADAMIEGIIDEPSLQAAKSYFNSVDRSYDFLCRRGSGGIGIIQKEPPKEAPFE